MVGPVTEEDIKCHSTVEKACPSLKRTSKVWEGLVTGGLVETGHGRQIGRAAGP